MKWSMELQNRGQVRKSLVLFLLQRQTAKPRQPFRPRLLLPYQPKHKRFLQLRWRASYIANTNGRHTARKPRTGKVVNASCRLLLPKSPRCKAVNVILATVVFSQLLKTFHAYAPVVGTVYAWLNSTFDEAAI